MNIIGLGQAGCQVAKNFENYDQYRIFYVDSENKGYTNFLRVKEEKSHEDYEKNYKRLNLKKCSGEATIILSGAGKISGCALRLLEQLKNLSLSVLYIKSDEARKSGNLAVRDRIVLGVLQQYARSSVIKYLYVVSNKNIESITGDLTIKNYWDGINNIISSTYHMINVFNKTEPLLSSKASLKDSARIVTFSVVNFNTGKEKLFYDLEYPRVKNYFYGVNNKCLEDKKTLSKVRDFVEVKNHDNVDVGFAIYPTDYEDNYVYSLHYASYVQEQKIE
jgi:hypothetical protein